MFKVLCNAVYCCSKHFLSDYVCKIMYETESETEKKELF